MLAQWRMKDGAFGLRPTPLATSLLDAHNFPAGWRGLGVCWAWGTHGGHMRRCVVVLTGGTGRGSCAPSRSWRPLAGALVARRRPWADRRSSVAAGLAAARGGERRVLHEARMTLSV
eukprot:scaffold19515_cov31-Tisochrysis_lutea.AAC.7